MARRKSLQRPDLIDNVIDQLRIGGSDRATTEALKIAVARMRAKRDPVRDRKGHDLVHHIGIAGMKPRGDVGRADQRHQRRILRLAEPPLPEPFAHVAVQIDRSCHTDGSCPWPLERVSGGWSLL